MNRQSIGKLVRYEREKKQISIQNLANGICSISTLQRVENGERLPDFFAFERIIERLGKSINKIEFLYHQGDYEIYYLREVIERYLEKKQYADVWKGLEVYEALKEAEEPIHKQYIFKMYGAIASEVEKNHQKAAMYLEEALRLTVPDFQIEKIGDYLLGEGEFVILLIWIQEKYQSGNDLSLLEMDSVLFSIEKICEDEEIRANLYCKAALVLGEILIGQGNHEKALELFSKGKDILVENGTLVHLPQIMERILNLSKNQNADLYNELKKQRDALKDLYEEYGEPWITEVTDIWKNYRQMEVYLVSELFEESRKMKGYTQEQLAEKLKIDPKTLSRIENGRFKPKDGTFRKVKEYLKIDRDICTTRIVTEDYSLLDMERQIAKLNHFRQEEKAEELYKELKSQLSLNWKENQQYVVFMDTLFDLELKRIDPEKAYQRSEQALRITQKKLKLKNLDKVILNRTELMILNYMTRCLDKLGQKEKTIEILEKVIKGYEKSKVDLKYHYPSLSLTYTHIAGISEECNRFEESMRWCDDAIKFDLLCKRGLQLGFMLEERIYAFERMTSNREDCKSKYLQAYLLLKLMDKKRHMITLQKYYKKNYGEEID